MPNKSPIEWTDYTSNPIRFHDAGGKDVWHCEKTSPGCKHCYAERIAIRLNKGGPFNAHQTKTVTPYLSEDELIALMKSRAISGKRVFIGDMTDIFGEWVPVRFLLALWMVFASRPDVTFQVLTKRADRARDILSLDLGKAIEVEENNDELGFPSLDAFSYADAVEAIDYGPLQNVWLGVSCEDQKRADERIPLLLQTPAAVRFVSAEPLLGPINLTALKQANGDDGDYFADALSGGCFEFTMDGRRSSGDGPTWFENAIDWVIPGGESNGRGCNVAWIRSIVRQCKAAGTACFVKQLGSDVHDRNDAEFDGSCKTAWPIEIEERDAIEHNPNGFREDHQGADVCVHLISRKGGDPSEWPEDLRVREFPAVEARP